MSRRCFLGLTAALLLGTAAPGVASEATAQALSSETALQRLLDGNRRFVTDQCRPRPAFAGHRAALARQQRPIAVVIGCADSRVPPELLFDQSLGELFVIRVAGHVINDAVLGSVEYAVEHLGTPLIVVLGHERCGAVQAALGAAADGGHLPALTSPIEPAVALAKHQVGDLFDQSVLTNVLMGVTRLKVSDPVLAGRVRTGRLRVVGARYDLDTGEVHLLPERLPLEPTTRRFVEARP